MQIIFIFSSGDSIILLKTLYELARWLIENRGDRIIFYLPEVNNLNLLPDDIVEVHWLEKNINPEDLPEADIIISTDLDILLSMNNLTRGELVFLDNGNNKAEKLFIPENIIVKNFESLPILIPDKFFHLSGQKRKKVVITGNFVDKEELNKVVRGLEKVVASTLPLEVIILGAPVEYDLNTHLKYSYIDLQKTNLYNLLSSSLYLLNFDVENFPILPYWAMAAGVFVLNFNLTEKDREFPLEMKKIDSIEIALTLIKIYKIGEFRSSIKTKALNIAKKYKRDESGNVWSNFLEKMLDNPEEKDDNFTKSINTSKSVGNLVDLVIINYNTLDYIKKNIKSIKKYTDIPYQIIVVDNGSTDGSIKYLNKLPDIKLIKNDKNMGYARACNQGILSGNGEYIILLNSDIEVSQGWLEPLIESAKEEDVAVVGPKLLNDKGEIMGAGVINLDDLGTPRGWKEKDGPGVYSQKEDVISVGGACYLIKRELLPIIGLFDEGYFFYYEEFDYSLRAREKGYRVVYNPESIVYHYHEGTLNPNDKKGRLERNNYFIQSRNRFMNKWSDLIAGGEKRREPKKIVVAGVIPWDFRQQRPQHLVRNLASMGYEVLYLNPVCTNKSKKGPIEVEENIHVYSPSGHGTVLFNLRHNNEISLGREIGEVLRNYSFENCILMINAPYWTPLLKYWEYSLLVYDCLDNYTEFDDLSKNKDWINKQEDILMDLADIIFTPSRKLYQIKKEKNENTFLLPNAVDLKVFNPEYIPESRPDDLPEYDKIIGYFGAVASWFDIELVAELAKELTEIGVVLIGEVSTDISELKDLENVVFLGEKPYIELPDYLFYFDLSIIPFKNNALTEMTNPVKLYEYLAAGKPVLSTDLPEVKEFEPVVEIARDKEEFIKKAIRLIKRDELNSDREERYNIVKTQTWRNRAETLAKILHLAYYDLFVTDISTLKEVEFEKEIPIGIKGEKRDNEQECINYPDWINKIKSWFKNG